MDGIKKIKIIALLAFFVAVMSLGIGYSSLNTTLEISGMANVYQEKYEVSLSNVHSLLKSEGDTQISTPIILNDTIIFDLKLTQLDNYVSFMFDIVNSGNQDAKITDVYVEGLNEYEQNLEVVYGENLKDKVIKAGEKVSNSLFKITYKNGIFDPYTGFQAIDLKGIKLVVKMAKV